MTPTDAARRAYWTEQMEAALAFMETMRAYPVEECGEGLVSLREAATAANVEVWFAGDETTPGLERLFYLRAGLIEGFLGAARAMNARGWILQVEHGFRSLEMQRQIARYPLVFDGILKTTQWELDGKIPSPTFLMRRVCALVAMRAKVGTHVSGSAIDVSVWRRDTQTEINRGGIAGNMSEITPLASPFVSPEAHQNRREITALMETHGLIAYPYEFWHYSGGDCYAEFLSKSGRPARYGAVHCDLEDGRTEPVEDADKPLLPLEIIEREIQTSLARMQLSREVT